MKLLPIVAGTAALSVGAPAAHADPPAVPCAAGVLSEAGCWLDLFGDGEPCVPEFVVFPDGEGFAEDCETDPPGAGENGSGATAAAPNLVGPSPPGDRLRRVRVLGADRTPVPVKSPARPGGDPTSIVQHPRETTRAERGSVDNAGAMRGGPPSAGLPPGFQRKYAYARPVLPQIVPGPAASAPTGSRLTMLAPTDPLRAGRRSWAGMVGAAVVAEVGLLWLVVGLILRRRGRSRSKA